MSWQLASFAILAAVLVGGFAWYERSRPPSQVVALVAAMAALAIAGRLAFAAFPNVKPTTDIVIVAGYALGPAPGFAVGAVTALVSNLWLGQGPWTPWQMLGWGLCGILGALLAMRAREVGRMTLAITCALAGVGYGALLNFSLMATYGGDLTLERFLALEARAIPFDAAHAIANFTLALVAGPAMIRMLARFRRRFEWRGPALAGAVVAALLLVAAAPQQAQAAGPESAADWLESVQNRDGGWGTDPDSSSGVATTAWVMLGLEAAGRHPLDVTSGGRTPVDYLRANVGELDSPGDFARTILALHGAGIDPRSFGGKNLPDALIKRRRSNGSYEGWPNSTAFAVIALRAVGVGGVDASMSWLAKVQNDDGGWGDVPGSPSTADGTGAVMQAMPGSNVAQRGLRFLRKAQRSNGGFSLGKSGTVNSQSTAWAAQGMVALGADPGSARDYLAARQADDGHYSYSSSSDQTPIWVTAQVIPAIVGEAFPISAPPRKPEPEPAPAPAPAPSETVPPPAPSFGGGLPPAAPAPSEPSSPGGSGNPLAPAVPGLPPASPGLPEGLPETGLPEAVDAEPASFTATPPEAPSPFVTSGIGVGAALVTLGGVILLGRRFGW